MYYWRKQVSGKHNSNQRQKQGCFLGPARVLATETHRESDGQLRAGSSIWIIRGRRLLKCCAEQLRFATKREELLEHLSSSEDAKAPWTCNRLTEGLGGNEFDDVSQDQPTEDEWMRDQDPTQQAVPMEVPASPRVRLRPVAPSTSSSSQPQPPTRQRVGTPPPDDELVVQEAWYSLTTEASRQEACGAEAWSDTEAFVEVALDLPDSKRGLQQFVSNLEGYFVGALKRRAVEVNLKHLTAEERAGFEQAKAVEVKNFIAAKAFEALPADLRPPEEKAIKMRWLLTWKLKDDGTTKPKARAILLGYQDPEYETRTTTSPVMTRQSRQLTLAATARFRWFIQKGDVTGAFLQGRTYPGELFCIPCPEICAAMGLDEGTITRVKKGCYGLVDAPIEWYRSISEFLEELGLVKSWSDPCMWMYKPQGVLRGLIAGHVDDFLFSGPSDCAEWNGILTEIKNRFKWTDWESKSFTQCGVQVEEQSDGSFHLSQTAYVEKIPEIFLNATRKKQTEENTTDREKGQLRATLGALSWYAQQTAPHVSAEVGLLLSEVSKSTVDTIVKTNKLVSFVKARKDHKMIIHAIAEDCPVGIFTWADAAGQNRKCGGSTQGIFIGMAPLSMLQGEVCKVIPLAWHSHKIERQCKSPGAAEAVAAMSGEDYMFHMRFQWSEMMSKEVDIFDVDSLVRKVPGCLISDSRNVYDKLQTDELAIKGAERRTDLELLCIKHSQRVTNLLLRWVHSEAQLGNSLTKGGSKELEFFYNLKSQWRMVSDEQMRSARKRRQEGLDILQQERTTRQHIHKPIQDGMV